MDISSLVSLFVVAFLSHEQQCTHYKRASIAIAQPSRQCGPSIRSVSLQQIHYHQSRNRALSHVPPHVTFLRRMQLTHSPLNNVWHYFRWHPSLATSPSCSFSFDKTCLATLWHYLASFCSYSVVVWLTHNLACTIMLLFLWCNHTISFVFF